MTFWFRPLAVVPAMLCFACRPSPASPPAVTAPVVTVGDAGVASAKETDVQAVHRVFGEYRGALLEKDGTRVLRLIDPRAIDLYGQLRKHALTASRDQFKKLDLMDKFVVLRLRHEFTRKQIEAMSAEEVLRVGVDRGWTGSGLPEADEVVVEGNAAKASSKGAKGIFVFFFVRQGNEWKFDLSKTMDVGRAAFRQMFEHDAEGMSEEEYAMKLVTVLSNDVNPAILNGPREK